MKVYNQIKLDLAILVGIIIFITLLCDQYRIGFDSTDNNITGKRSGLHLYVDHKTGIEYISTSNGNLIRRIQKK